MRAVYLKWIDSFAPDTSAWKCEHDLDMAALKERAICESVGILINEDDDVLLLTSSTGGKEHERLAYTPLLIPKVAILDRRELEVL